MLCDAVVIKATELNITSQDLLERTRNTKQKFKQALLNTVTFTTALATLNHQSYNSNDWLSPHGLESELYSWRMKWQRHLAEHGENSLPRTLEKTLKQISSMNPNISAMVRLVATLPATTCSAERSFSSLKRIKHHSELLWQPGCPDCQVYCPLRHAFQCRSSRG